MRMRAVYRLIGLVRQHGPDAVEAACSRALDVDIIAVTKIASMLAKATEKTAPVLPVPAPAGAARFARDPSEYATGTTAVATAGTTMARKGTMGPAGPYDWCSSAAGGFWWSGTASPGLAVGLPPAAVGRVQSVRRATN
jgi:hypothetical protein